MRDDDICLVAVSSALVLAFSMYSRFSPFFFLIHFFLLSLHSSSCSFFIYFLLVSYTSFNSVFFNMNIYNIHYILLHVSLFCIYIKTPSMQVCVWESKLHVFNNNKYKIVCFCCCCCYYCLVLPQCCFWGNNKKSIYLFFTGVLRRRRIFPNVSFKIYLRMLLI